MDENDIKLMKEAIAWADDCKPVNASIPKVGAIIAVGKEVLGRGRRGTGRTDDDEHAEKNALKAVTQTSKLRQATLYTTLEPCTPGVRSKPHECCTQLIRLNQITKVYIGILDPNQGVTGKGLWELQDKGVEVELFPPELARDIRAINTNFINAQQTLGAKILSPINGEELKTYETHGKHTIRFTCNNPPQHNTHLFTYYAGLWWPQPGNPRRGADDVWEYDAFFSSPGEHGLYLVTVTPLGQVLVDYFRRIVASNRKCRQDLQGKLPDQYFPLLGAEYPGIPMTGLPKGILEEASVNVVIAKKK